MLLCAIVLALVSLDGVISQYQQQGYQNPGPSNSEYQGGPNLAYPRPVIPGYQYPGSQGSGYQSPGSQNTGFQGPASQSPGGQYPGVQYTGGQYPGNQYPGIYETVGGAPGNNELSPSYPNSFQQSVPQNPCPNYFQYTRNETSGAVMGLIIVKPYTASDNYELELNMTVMDAVQQTDGLRITVLSGQQEILGGSVIKYGVSFPYSAKSAVPFLTQIKFNGQILCSGSAPPLGGGQVQSAMWAKSSIKTVKGGSPVMNTPAPPGEVNGALIETGGHTNPWGSGIFDPEGYNKFPTYPGQGTRYPSPPMDNLGFGDYNDPQKYPSPPPFDNRGHMSDRPDSHDFGHGMAGFQDSPAEHNQPGGNMMDNDVQSYEFPVPRSGVVDDHKDDKNSVHSHDAHHSVALADNHQADNKNNEKSSDAGHKGK